MWPQSIKNDSALLNFYAERKCGKNGPHKKGFNRFCFFILLLNIHMVFDSSRHKEFCLKVS
jgi:hypothetical protein